MSFLCLINSFYRRNFPVYTIDPIERIGPTEPIDQIDPIDPIHPIARMDRIDCIDRTDPIDRYHRNIRTLKFMVGYKLDILVRAASPPNVSLYHCMHKVYGN